MLHSINEPELDCPHGSMPTTLELKPDLVLSKVGYVHICSHSELLAANLEAFNHC